MALGAETSAGGRLVTLRGLPQLGKLKTLRGVGDTMSPLLRIAFGSN